MQFSENIANISAMAFCFTQMTLKVRQSALQRHIQWLLSFVTGIKIAFQTKKNFCFSKNKTISQATAKKNNSRYICPLKEQYILHQQEIGYHPPFRQFAKVGSVLNRKNTDQWVLLEYATK